MGEDFREQQLQASPIPLVDVGSEDRAWCLDQRRSKAGATFTIDS